MNNEIYEVTRDEYAGFLAQIKSEYCKSEVIGRGEPHTEIDSYSKDSTRHFAKRIIDDELGEKYYIFDMPLDYERCAPKKVRKIRLENKEEVQAFFDILSKCREEKKDE